MKKRSLEELDNVLEEIIALNPKWVKEIDDIIKKQLNSNDRCGRLEEGKRKNNKG